MADKNAKASALLTNSPPASDNASSEELVNASGHVQELQRNFNLWSLSGIGIVVGNVWPAAGGAILVALFNGGPPGIPNIQLVAIAR